MHILELYKLLKESYQAENLNALSSNIISLYRNKDISTLRRMHALIYCGNQGAEYQISRIFSKIIMNYHPDRIIQINKNLDGFLKSDDFEGMKSMDHILDVQKLDISHMASGSSIDADFDYEDLFDYSAGGYTYIDDEEREHDEYDMTNEMIFNHGFINAVKRKVYGHINVDFPAHLLADMEIIEMAEYEIENLDGVEYCTYARIIDLSGNNLTEITQLGQMMRLEEIFIQNNHISYLDGLHELPYLRVLDLSHNDVGDLSPLFELDTLEFINVIGNRIPEWQLEKLSLAGVIVVS
jgi:hypothetical protein